jgi:5-methylcytosine-specific restriction enzyme subunit McrC
MARVFEEFVRNFYRNEQCDYQVSARTIKWSTTDISPKDAELLPTMRTDIFLSGKEDDIIVDTKYYNQTMQENFDKTTFRSGHLYQIYSYLMNYIASNEAQKSVSGILIYPKTQHHLDSSFEISGRRFRVTTIDLSEDWSSISASLKSKLTRRVISEIV